MKPNRSGGHIFEPHELGTVTNILSQAELLVRAVGDEAAGAGHSPSYSALAMQFGLHRPSRADLLSDIRKIGTTIKVLGEDDHYSATMNQTQVVMSCLKWAVEAGNSSGRLVPLMTSAEQLQQAEGMITWFLGSTAISEAS